METIKLKLGLHKMIDEQKNKQLLMAVYDFLKSRQNEDSSLWELLSDEQQKEVLLAFEESENADNLIDKETFFAS